MVGKRRATLILLLILCFLVVTLPEVETVRAAEDSWTTLEPMPTARSGLGVAVVDGKIYAIASNVNYEYNPATDTWSTKTAMPTPRAESAIAVYQNKIYVIGGVVSGGPVTSGINGVTEVYDPSTDTWETKTSMPTPRDRAVANEVNGKIYVIVGNTYVHIADSYVAVLTNVTEVYDPETDSWASKASMPYFYGAGLSEVMSAVINKKIYVISSYLAGMGSADLDTLTQIYDPTSDLWSLGTTIPIDVHGAAAGATTGEMAPTRIYVIGGGWDDFNPFNLTQVYDPDENVWSTATPMLTPRAGHAVAVVNDRLYAIGGTVGQIGIGTATDINEQYIPVGYIPEFPSWTPLLFTFIALVVVLAVYRRKLRKAYSVKEMMRKNSIGRAQRNS